MQASEASDMESILNLCCLKNAGQMLLIVTVFCGTFLLNTLNSNVSSVRSLVQIHWQHSFLKRLAPNRDKRKGIRRWLLFML